MASTRPRTASFIVAEIPAAGPPGFLRSPHRKAGRRGLRSEACEKHSLAPIHDGGCGKTRVSEEEILDSHRVVGNSWRHMLP